MMDSESQVEKPGSSNPPSVGPYHADTLAQKLLSLPPPSFVLNQNNVLVLPLVERGKLLWVNFNQFPQDLSGVRTLDAAFEVFPYPTWREMDELARHCSIHADQVRVWFMAQRIRYGISWDREDIRQVRMKLFPQPEEGEGGAEDVREEDGGEFAAAEVRLETNKLGGVGRGEWKRKGEMGAEQTTRSSKKTRGGMTESKREDGAAGGKGGRVFKEEEAAKLPNMTKKKMKRKKEKEAKRKDPCGEKLTKTRERNRKAVRSQTGQSSPAEKRRPAVSEAVVSHVTVDRFVTKDISDLHHSSNVPCPPTMQKAPFALNKTSKIKPKEPSSKDKPKERFKVKPKEPSFKVIPKERFKVIPKMPSSKVNLKEPSLKVIPKERCKVIPKMPSYKFNLKEPSFKVIPKERFKVIPKMPSSKVNLKEPSFKVIPKERFKVIPKMPSSKVNLKEPSFKVKPEELSNVNPTEFSKVHFTELSKVKTETLIKKEMLYQHGANIALLPGDDAQPLMQGSSVNTAKATLTTVTSLAFLPEPETKPGPSELHTAALPPSASAVVARERPPKVRDFKHKTSTQVQMLRRSFICNQFPNRTDYDQLEVLTALPRRDLVQWFGDTRHYMKQKKPRWLKVEDYSMMLTKIKHRQRIKALAIAEASRPDGPRVWELKVEQSEMMNDDRQPHLYDANVLEPDWLLYGIEECPFNNSRVQTI